MSENDSKIPKWLRDTQIRSWEPEILLSGIVLFGLFRVPGLLDDFLWYVKNNISATEDWDNFVSFMKVAVYWLITGLFLHLIARGLWIGLVGLSYVFPKGVNKEKLAFKYGFKNTILRIPFPVDSIERLERLCSSLFSIAFMLFMSIIGAYLYIFVVLFIPIIGFTLVTDYTVYDQPEWFDYYLFTVVIISAIYLLDFVTSGLLKRIPIFSKVYYPVHKVISTLTLSPIYRPIYYSLVSNFNRWWISLFYLVFFVSTITMAMKMNSSSGQVDNWTNIELFSRRTTHSIFSGYYEDRNVSYSSFNVQIPSDVIESNVLRVFININMDYHDRIKASCEYDSLSEVVNNLDSLKLSCVTNYYHLLLNDSLVTDYQMKFYNNQRTSQKGVLCYLDIRNLDMGYQELKLTRPDTSRVISRVPFYRVKD